MGLKAYGIVAAQSPDREGETILIEGVDISNLKRLKDEHPEQDSSFHEIGDLRNVKKIFSEADCEHEKHRRAWEFAKVPLIYAESEYSNDFDHPNAKAAAALTQFAMRPDSQLAIGWSIDGGIIQRTDNTGKSDEEGKVLARTVGLAAALTVKPCNPKCKIWLENDLQKSIVNAPAPSNYLELLQKSTSKHSFRDVMGQAEVELFIKLNKLKKSLEDYHHAFTTVNCVKCGNGIRFFKSSNEIPNSCSKCGNSYSMSDIWKALNK